MFVVKDIIVSHKWNCLEGAIRTVKMIPLRFPSYMHLHGLSVLRLFNSMAYSRDCLVSTIREIRTKNHQ